ncbi:LuxR C-terminal-related transcriptional regulator [Actinoplanes sp. NPDC051411]|uniref:LuxR C-terminal-related transcriptional regulator n=1 Tax=Actinoplanes sp. NPDC051411 TaxID=3155522 RepID=UPI00342620B2
MSPLVAGFRLDEAVADVFGDLRLAAVLKRLLGHTRRLTGSVAGSVSLVDPDHGSYVKVAEYGDFCRLGDSFPLDEGATGQAYGERQPVVIADYGRMRTNHLHGRHPGRKGPAAAVPIWWRGDVIAVNVAFTGKGGRFSAREVDDLEALTQTAAAAIIQSGRREASPAGEIRRRFGGVVTEAGLVRPVSPELARAAADLVAAAARRRPHPRLHVAIVYRPQGLRVLVQDESTGLPAGEPDPLGMGTTTWEELLRHAGGGVTVQEVRGWGVLVRADLPYSIGADVIAPGTAEDDPPDTRSGAGRSAETGGPVAYGNKAGPLTPRETEVLALLREGLTDRAIAARLVLSAKTVEKHVGAIMRKTNTTNRTAAVMAVLRNEW